MQVLLSTKLAHFVSVIHSPTPVITFVAELALHKTLYNTYCESKSMVKIDRQKAPVSPRWQILITATIIAAVCVVRSIAAGCPAAINPSYPEPLLVKSSSLYTFQQNCRQASSLMDDKLPAPALCLRIPSLTPDPAKQ